MALVDEGEATAAAAGLRYVDGDEPGIHRRRRGKGFSYHDAGGAHVTDARVLERITSLAVPPAWTDVWICSDDAGHIQATGRDARARKQYRYHARWQEVRDEAKFGNVVGFAEVLPRIRARVDEDLGERKLSRRKVLAAVVRLLDTTSLRVGNETYVEENGTYGLATLRTRHVKLSGSTIELVFRGKSGKRRREKLTDRRLAAVVKRCQELPGQHLFGFVDEDGDVHEVRSDDVNDYLREASGRDVTSKDFRTWAATVAAATALLEAGPRGKKAAKKKSITSAVESAAALLGNTPAVCRKSYVHPAVLDGYDEGVLCDALSKRAAGARGLDAEERRVLRFLRGWREKAA